MKMQRLTGKAASCGHNEWLSPKRFATLIKIQADADETYYREMEEATKQEMEKGMPETLPMNLSDDEIPF